MRKLLSIVLSLLMVLAILPMATFSVSAADYTITTEAELAEYLSNNSQDNITLGDDIIVTSPIKNQSGRADTLLLNGHTITYSPGDDTTTEAMIQELASQWDQSKLTIKNSDADNGGFENQSSNAPLFATTGQAQVVFNSGTFYGDLSAKIEGTNALTFNGANMIIKGAVNATGTMNVTQTVTFESTVTCDKLTTSSQNSTFNGDVNVKTLEAAKGVFGNITATDSFKASGAITANNVTADYAAISAGAKITTLDANEAYLLKATIENVTVAKKAIALNATINGALTATANSDVLIVGGTTNAVTGEGNFVIKGGKFNFDPTDYLYKDAVSTAVGETYQVVSYAFDVNGAKFSNIAAAQTAASTGATIKLIDDYYITSDNTTFLTLTKNDLTLDLNGYTISDLSDKGAFSGSNKFIYCNSTDVTKFKLTDSTYNTTGGGKIVIHGGGSNSGTEYCFAFKAISDSTTPVDLTFENCSVNTNTSCYVNNGGIMNLSGGSIADNTLKFKNFTLKNITTSGNTGQGYNGILVAAKFDITADNFDYFAERNAFMLNVNNISLNIKNSKIGYARTYGINLSSNANVVTTATVNAENSKFYNTTLWGGNIVNIGNKIADTTQTFKNCSFDVYKGTGILTSGVNNAINLTSCTFTNLTDGSVYPLTVGGTDTMKAYDCEFIATNFDSKIATINANATLILDKNSRATNTFTKNSNGTAAAFLMNGTSDTAKANLIVNHFTATGYRNFVTSKNNYANIYIEDLSFEKDEGRNQWNGGGNFVDKGTVTLGEGYNVYVDDNEEPYENFNWLSNDNIGKVFVNNPNLRLVTVGDETYKVNLGSTFVLPENTSPDFKGYTLDYKTLVQPGEEIVVNENMVFNPITKILSDSDFTIDTTDKIYTGSDITTDITTDINATNYKVSYDNNVNVGEATVTITGARSCFGSVSATFNITPKDLDEADLTVDTADKVYRGNEIKPVVTSDILTMDDYDVVYTNNTNVGEATITITGKGNYGSGIVKHFNITKKTISENDFNFDLIDKTYTRNEIKPDVIAKKIADTDFEVIYTNNINKGEATITVNGIGNNCEGQIVKHFNIFEKAIADDDFTFDLTDKTYTGLNIEPQVTADVLTADDYDVVYTDNKNVGKATITITGKGNYKGQIVKHFNIVEKAITESDFTFDLADKVYTGSEIKPDVTSTLGENDYEVVYTNNTNAGEATITITGKGNYNSEVVKHFNITAKALTDADFDAIADRVYANRALEPSVTALNNLITSNDYDVVYTDNTNVGEATVTITGKNNFSGQIVKHFNITVKTISDDDFTIDLVNKVYTGSEIKPDVTSETLKETDFEVIYTSNINKGEATITVNGIGNNCEGQIVKHFSIVEKAITEADFTFDLADKVYTGSEIKPVVTSTLGKNDYEVVYTENIVVGTATITVNGIGNYGEQIVKRFNIIPKAINATMFNVDKSTVVYNGKAFAKSVVSGLTANDYTVTYSNNTNVGTATITITGIGNYTGTVTQTFTITKPKVTVKVKKVTASSTAKKKVTVKWKKAKNIDGYAIKVSLKKSLKGKGTKTIYTKNAKTAKKVIAKLKSNKKYFVGVAGYKKYKNSANKTLKVIGKFTKAKKAVTIK